MWLAEVWGQEGRSQDQQTRKEEGEAGRHEGDSTLKPGSLETACLVPILATPFYGTNHQKGKGHRLQVAHVSALVR